MKGKEWLRLGVISMVVVVALVYLGFLASSLADPCAFPGAPWYPGGAACSIPTSSGGSSVTTGGNFDYTSPTSTTAVTPTSATKPSACDVWWAQFGSHPEPGMESNCPKPTGYALLSLLLFSGPMLLTALFWVVLVAGLLLLGFLLAKGRRRGRRQ